MSEPSLPDKVVAIHERLSEARVPHAFGGALALAYYAEPRTTIDIDVNVFLAPERYPQVHDALAPLGIEEGNCNESLERDGQCRAWWDRNPLDLFFSYDEIHGAMRAEARVVPFGEERIPVLSPEHLVVCKATFDRAKDWLDIEQVLVGVEDLDVAAIRSWLDRLVGSADTRRLRFEDLAARYLED